VKLLVTGGAGYIGAHVSFSLLAAGYEIVILVDFSTGVKELLDDLNQIQVA
jgi:UDP-glucose 4-epimerase